MVMIVKEPAIESGLAQSGLDRVELHRGILRRWRLASINAAMARLADQEEEKER
jgi:hypothetical protein